MPARLEIRESARISPEQENALTLAAQTLPDAWVVLVRGETTIGQVANFSVRIVGPRFAAPATFRPDVKPEKLLAFVETTRRERGGQE